jgi:undecaprenyl-diphosphatase
MSAQPASWFDRVDAFEYRFCVRLNIACERALVLHLFRTVSRLGDGMFWYALMAFLALAWGPVGRLTALEMLLAAAVGLALYKALKHRLVRERPYITHAAIRAGTRALDRYSFPSGHTLHAVSFTVVAVAHFPVLAPVLVPFALLVAASRVILGLHYPTDVLAGATIGALLATGALALG